VCRTPMTEARADQMIELKRDVEKETGVTRIRSPDDGVRGSKMRGLGRWIYDGAATLTLDRTITGARQRVTVN